MKYPEDHKELFNYLMEAYCLRPEDKLFMNNIAERCGKQGIAEPDRARPLKLVLNSPQGCKMRKPAADRGRRTVCRCLGIQENGTAEFFQDINEGLWATPLLR